jgi:hypothetical protein
MYSLGDPAQGGDRSRPGPGRHHPDAIAALQAEALLAAEFIETITLTGTRMHILTAI